MSNWERATRKWFSFLCFKGEMKYEKQVVDWNLKLRQVPKFFENSWLMTKINGRPAHYRHLAMVAELDNLNDINIFIWPMLFLLVWTTRSAWWPCNPGLGKNFPPYMQSCRQLTINSSSPYLILCRVILWMIFSPVPHVINYERVFTLLRSFTTFNLWW